MNSRFSLVLLLVSVCVRAQYFDIYASFNGTCSNPSLVFYQSSDACGYDNATCSNSDSGDGDLYLESTACGTSAPTSTQEGWIWFVYWNEAGCSGDLYYSYGFPADGKCRQDLSDGAYYYATCNGGTAKWFWCGADSTCNSANCIDDTSGLYTTSCTSQSSNSVSWQALCPSGSGSTSSTGTTSSTSGSASLSPLLGHGVVLVVAINFIMSSLARGAFKSYDEQ